MRVQCDESNLLATSLGMHELGTATMATEAIVRDGEVMALDLMVDKRPPLFPFFVSLLHAARGFSVDNAYLLNAVALFALLALVATAVRRRVGTLAALAAVMLVASPPVVITGARSAASGRSRSSTSRSMTL